MIYKLAAFAVLLVDPASALLAPQVGVSRVSQSRVATRAPVVFLAEEAEDAPAPAKAAPKAAAKAPTAELAKTTSGWSMKDITPDGSLTQRVEGKTRKTWKFNNLAKDRVQIAVTSEGRPVHSDIQLWLGPDWTPFSMKAYTEDGKLRPIQTLVGTRNKAAMIEVRNIGEYEFPFNAASNYADDAMATIPHEIPATTPGERVDGGALRFFPLDPAAKQLEIVLNTDGKQLNARIELLNGPNNRKQLFECFTNNGDLNRLCVCFETPDAGNTVRIENLAPVEFPCYIHFQETY